MLQVSLPQSDLSVSQICLGTGSFGSSVPEEAAFKLLDAFVAAGGNFIDSARIYAMWLPDGANASERTIGNWQRSRGLRDQIVIATKGAHPDLKTMHLSRLSRADIQADIRDSLKYLQTDVIDVYWLHRDDPQRPMADILETLNSEVQAGTIRYFGCSNWRVTRIREAADYARQAGWQSFIANQPMWSLAEPNRENIGDKTMVLMDTEDLDYHRETGMAVIPYTAQARGYFTKLAHNTLKDGDIRQYDNARNRLRYERAGELAARHNVPITSIALSYLTSQPFPVIPIIGAHTSEQLADSLSHTDLQLSPEELHTLTAD